LLIYVFRGFSKNSKWERRILSARQTILLSVAIERLRPEDVPEGEIAKILVFVQRAMRQTAWNHLWIPYADIGLPGPDPEEPEYPEPEFDDDDEPSTSRLDKGKEIESSTDNYNNNSHHEDEEMLEISHTHIAKREYPVPLDSDWGPDRRGLKVWLRRTFIFQLLNLMDG